MSAKKIKVTQIKSSIGILPKHGRTLRALGLRKIDAARIHDNTPVIRGMINQVCYLVKVEDAK